MPYGASQPVPKEDLGDRPIPPEGTVDGVSFPFKMNPHPRVIQTKPGGRTTHVPTNEIPEPSRQAVLDKEMEEEKERKYNLRHKYDDSKSNFYQKIQMEVQGKG